MDDEKEDLMTTQVETLAGRRSELDRDLNQVTEQLTSLRNQLGTASMEGDGGGERRLQAEIAKAENRAKALEAGLEALDKELEKAREASALRHQKSLLSEYYSLVAERLRLREPVARLALQLDEARRPLQAFDQGHEGGRKQTLYNMFIGSQVTIEHAHGILNDGGNDPREILEDVERFEALAAELKQEVEATE